MGKSLVSCFFMRHSVVQDASNSWFMLIMHTARIVTAYHILSLKTLFRLITLCISYCLHACAVASVAM